MLGRYDEIDRRKLVHCSGAKMKHRNLTDLQGFPQGIALEINWIIIGNNEYIVDRTMGKGNKNCKSNMSRDDKALVQRIAPPSRVRKNYIHIFICIWQNESRNIRGQST